MAKKRRGGGVPHARLADETLPQRKARNRAIIAVALLVLGGWMMYRYCMNNLVGIPADTVTIETSKGTFVMKVYPTLVPETVRNFRELAESDFYDGLKWHRVEDWVVQTGDPTGTGMGGSEKTLPLEINPKLRNRKGAVGMARASDPDSATSQFYILRRDASSLDDQYAVFGRVVEGMDVVNKLEVDDLMIEVTYEKTSEEPAKTTK